MPVAKHSSPPISPARLVFLSAVTILIALVVWVAVRAVGPSGDEAARPTVVLPSMPTVPVGAEVSESPSPSVTPSPSSPSPTPSRSRPASPSIPASARHSASPSPHTSRSPAATASFAATLTVTPAWRSGYGAMVQVVNKGTKTASWSVSVSHSGESGLRLGGTWNAHGSQQGSTFVFTGGSLAPGKSATFGYQADKQGGGRFRPSGCSVSSGTCRVS